MSALIDVVDKEDAVLHTATIQEVRDTGSWHRYVRLIVTDGQGSYLLQFRGPQNRIFPECWDFSAAGHVDAGETYEFAASRELTEELGIVAPIVEIESYTTQDVYDGQELNRFNKTFQVTVDKSTVLDIDPNEVLDARWYTVSELKSLIVDNPDKVTPSLATFAESLQ